MIPVENPHLHVVAISHEGMKGKENEDRYIVNAHQLSEDNDTPSTLVIVADGVGGHRAGEVASQIATEKISQAIASSDGQRPVEILSHALDTASQAIWEAAQEDSNRKGMGATCVCSWIIGNQLYASWLGDSRLYLIREDTITQLTTDHTWIQEAINHGIITPEQITGHPNAHVIHRHLGSQHHSEPDFRLRTDPNEKEGSESNQGMRLLAEDHLLLCTDGLTDLVTDEEISTAVKSYAPEQAVQGLVNLANARGGHDNITIVLAKMLLPTNNASNNSAHLATKGRFGTLHISLTCAIVAAIILFLGIVIVLLIWLMTISG